MPVTRKALRGYARTIRSLSLVAIILMGVSPVRMPVSRLATVSNPCGPREEATKAQLVAAAIAGGEYLIRMQKPNGSFVYSYDPELDHESSNNNVVRHAGAVVSLLDLYAYTNDRRFLASAERATGFLKTRFKANRKGARRKAVYVLDFDGKAKLGANGLALVALTRLAELDRNKKWLGDATAVAEMILSMQRKDGGFESYYRLNGDDPEGDVSLYYPGEAMLGLVRLYEFTKDARLIESVRRGAEYLIQSERAQASLPLDAWFAQALEALYALDPKPEYAAHAIALAEAMMADQYADGEDDFLGGFGPGIPRATPAASRCEGLLAAYRLATATSDRRANDLLESIGLALRFQLSQQFTKDNVGDLRRPARAVGGFRESPTEARIRIDFVQHNISSLLGAARVSAGGFRAAE